MSITDRIICAIFGHRWSQEEHRPCEKIKTCFRCKEEEVKKGWHAFTNWTAPYNVQVYETRGNKNLTVNQERQKRNCTDCNIVEERPVLY